MLLLTIYLIGLVICMVAFLLLCYFRPDVIPKFGLDVAGSDILGTFFFIMLLLIYPFLLTVILPLYLIGKWINNLINKGKKRQARIKQEKTIGEKISKYY